MKTSWSRSLCKLGLTGIWCASQLGCRIPMEGPVAHTVVEVLQTEDRTWQGICSDLGAADGETGPALLDKYQVRESINDVKALHDALRKTRAPLPECMALKTGGSTLNAAGACMAAIHENWQESEAEAKQFVEDAKDVAANAKKLLTIVQAAVDDPDTALRDLTRELNFSLVVLVRLAELAQVSEQTIDDVTESLGWWSAAVRIPLKLVVAEVLVRLNEFVMMEIERRGWITPSDTARTSCKLLQQGSYRTTVQTRLLRRTVLRFGDRSVAVPCEAEAGICALEPAKMRGATTVKELCDTIDEESNDLCRRALRKMRVPHRKVANILDPAHLLVEAEPSWQDFDPGIQIKADALLAAAPVCEQIESSMRCLSDVASVFIFAPTTVWLDRPLDPHEIRDLRSRISEMRGALGSFQAEMRRSLNQAHEDNRAVIGSIARLESAMTGPLTAKIEAALRERCAGQITKLEEVRLGRAAALLKELPQAPGVDRPPLNCRLEQPAAPVAISKQDGVSVFLDYAAMCNPFEQSYLTFTVDGTGLFPSCSCELPKGTRGQEVADGLARRIRSSVSAESLKKIEIIGHADPSGIESPCRQCKNVTENDMLSQYRAEAFAEVVKNGLAGYDTTNVVSRGAGSTEPVDGKRCSVGDKDCYTKNRRIEARLVLGEGWIDPQECVSKPGKKRQ